MKKHISMILIVVMAISYIAIGGQTAVAGGTAPTSCDDFSYWTQRLCTKYCEKLECDEEIPHYETLRRWLCKYYGTLFEKKTGIEPPCACAHSPTETGEALNPNCDPNVDCVCISNALKYCCDTEWDLACICQYECVTEQGCCTNPDLEPIEQAGCRSDCFFGAVCAD